MNPPPASPSKPEPQHWHALPVADTLAHHGVQPEHGLSEDEAAARLARHGPNQPRQVAGRSALQRFLAQLKEPLVLVLIGCRRRHRRARRMGRQFGNPRRGRDQRGDRLPAGRQGRSRAGGAGARRRAEVTVVRAGRGGAWMPCIWCRVTWFGSAAGDKVPADLRILSGRQLRTVEAALTGEAAPIDKHHEALPEDTLLADRRNMAYAGTTVVAGQGHGLVIATANDTETGRISGLIADAHRNRHAADAQDGRVRRTAAVGDPRPRRAHICDRRGTGRSHGRHADGSRGAGGRGYPEGLPAAMSITLAIGVGRMAKRRAIIRHLPAVEALGSTTVICSDKTGTLTENAMTVTELWAGGEAFMAEGQGYRPEGRVQRGETAVAWPRSGAPGTQGAPAPSARDTVSGAAGDITSRIALHETLLAGLLCKRCAHHEHRQWQITGDPTEAALLVVARKAGLDEATLRSVFRAVTNCPSIRRARPWPPARDRRRTGGLCQGCHRKAAARLPRHAGRRWQRNFRSMETAALEASPRLMAARGLRVLALARRRLAAGEALDEATVDSNLVFLGLVGMIDPPRARAVSAVRTCHAAGIEVKMITGDHAATARAIAAQIGIIKDGRPTEVLTGRDLAGSTTPNCSTRRGMSTSSPGSNRSRSCAWCARCRRGARWWR
jgi:cation-transporting ATPase F